MHHRGILNVRFGTFPFNLIFATAITSMKESEFKKLQPQAVKE